MAQLYAAVTLRNAREYALARHGRLPENQVHTYVSPRGLIDTHALHVLLPARHTYAQPGNHRPTGLSGVTLPPPCPPLLAYSNISVGTQ